MRKYENYVSALKVLREAPFQDLNNEFVQSGLIGKFALQFELSWKLLKRVLSYEGDARAASGSPREIITEAYTISISSTRKRGSPCCETEAVRRTSMTARLPSGWSTAYFTNTSLSLRGWKARFWPAME